jgi:hypothetical protein
LWYQKFLLKTNAKISTRKNLLTLVRHLHWLAFGANWGVRRRLLGWNCVCLVLELSKGHSPSRDKADFLEAFEALEDGGEVVCVDVARNVLQEQDLVRPDVFVGDNGSSSLRCARLLGRDCGVGLCFRILFRALEICIESVFAVQSVHREKRTFLHEPLALVLVEHVTCFAFDCLVAVRFCHSNPHLLAEHWEAIDNFDSFLGSLLALEDDKSLTFALYAALSNDVDDGAEVFEDDSECIFHVFDGGALLEVVDLLLLASRRMVRSPRAA